MSIMRKFAELPSNIVTRFSYASVTVKHEFEIFLNYAADKMANTAISVTICRA